MCCITDEFSPSLLPDDNCLVQSINNGGSGFQYAHVQRHYVLASNIFYGKRMDYCVFMAHFATFNQINGKFTTILPVTILDTTALYCKIFAANTHMRLTLCIFVKN